MDYDEFKGHMNSYNEETKKEEELFNRVKNAVMEEMKGGDKEKKEDAPNAEEEGSKKEEKEESPKEKKEEGDAANALPSEKMIRDFSDALGVTFKKGVTLKELAAVSGVEGATDAVLITALNAKRDTFGKPAGGSGAVAKKEPSGAKSVADLLNAI